MIATIATIAEIELRSISAIVSLRSLESGFHMIAAIAELFSSAEIVAIIWKPGYVCLK